MLKFILMLYLTVLSGDLWADRYDREVEIINNTGYTMQRFFASNVDSPNWEEDILGNQVVMPYESVWINIDDGTGYCLFDLRALFDDGTEVVRNTVNVCEVESWTVHD